MSINNQPIFLIFDLDCIIGDLYTDKYYNIITYILDNCKHKRITDFCNLNYDLWKKSLNINIIRPYFKEFIEEI